MQNIDLINQYLYQRLSGDEVLMFENRIKADENFKKLYHQHFIFLEGLKRVALKEDIQKAYKSYLIHKRIKMTGGSILILILLVLAYMLFLSQSDVIEILPKKEKISSFIIADTIANKVGNNVVSSYDSVEESQVGIDALSTIKGQDDKMLAPIRSDSVSTFSQGRGILYTDSLEIKENLDNSQKQDTELLFNILIGEEANQEQIKNSVILPSLELNILGNEAVNKSDSLKEVIESIENNNSFNFNGKEYQLENCDIANESYGEISKWEIDLFCCMHKLYYNNNDKKEISPLIYLNLKSLKTDKLVEGRYTHSKENSTERKPLTFSGDIKVGSQLVKISDGEINLLYDDSGVQISFHLKVNGNKWVNGNYSGVYNIILNKKE